MKFHSHPRWQWLGAVVAVFVIIGAITMTQAILGLRTDVQNNKEGVQCVLRELLVHRHRNYEADKQQNEALGLGWNFAPPPEVPEDWDDVCAHFVGEVESFGYETTHDK
jgi:hypothetical protein